MILITLMIDDRYGDKFENQNLLFSVKKDEEIHLNLVFQIHLVSWVFFVSNLYQVQKISMENMNRSIPLYTCVHLLSKRSHYISQ